MKTFLNLLRGAVLLAAGLFLLLVPYAKFQGIFPKAPAPAVVRVLGAVVVFCGVLVLLALLSGKRL